MGPRTVGNPEQSHYIVTCTYTMMVYRQLNTVTHTKLFYTQCQCLKAFIMVGVLLVLMIRRVLKSRIENYCPDIHFSFALTLQLYDEFARSNLVWPDRYLTWS